MPKKTQLTIKQVGEHKIDRLNNKTESPRFQIGDKIYKVYNENLLVQSCILGVSFDGGLWYYKLTHLGESYKGFEEDTYWSHEPLAEWYKTPEEAVKHWNSHITGTIKHYESRKIDLKNLKKLLNNSNA